VCCLDATASYFVSKVQSEVFMHFHAVTIKCHSSIRNRLWAQTSLTSCGRSVSVVCLWIKSHGICSLLFWLCCILHTDTSVVYPPQPDQLWVGRAGAVVPMGWRKCDGRWKIWGFHGGDYEEWCLLGCYAMWFL
jgi:hypothetical protein